MQAQRDVGRLGHGKIGVNNKRRIVAGLEKGRLKTSVASFAKKSEAGFAKKSEAGFAKKSEAGFAKTDKVNFAKTNVLIGLSDDLERKMVYKTEKIFHFI
ncbi:hypothetical protein QP713_04665 [Neisseria mucosa]|uniref:Uncharacterized protein n=1 Tax=Neisseria mucosa TaxID=488 RepID=A0AAW6Z642_NEIMU|nr:hypothetical protein [Neisseria mucosa]MDK6726117.1 hypothetical protein [Neisseria mucosa]MDK6870479.1 hypothetical protein [Neisseria mucosa]MDK8110088.1 hypothetical protein [Neisseria mucosa]MDK8361381.1 hypothetical protein [Neisseria mucosa]